MSGATILRPAAVLLLLAATVPARAQPAPGTPADAELAAVRLVEATRARDWRALAAFVGLQDIADLLDGLPATAEEADEQLREELAEDGLDADSVLAAVDAGRPTGEDEGARTLVHLYRWFGSLYANGALDKTELIARMLAGIVRCSPDSLLAFYDGARYDPVRADIRADGTVEVIGRLAATVEGERVEGLAVTPLRWAEGRWTVDRATPSARDTALNPIAEAFSQGALGLFYGLVGAVHADVTGAAPGCSGIVE